MHRSATHMQAAQWISGSATAKARRMSPSAACGSCAAASNGRAATALLRIGEDEVSSPIEGSTKREVSDCVAGSRDAQRQPAAATRPRAVAYPLRVELVALLLQPAFGRDRARRLASDLERRAVDILRVDLQAATVAGQAELERDGSARIEGIERWRIQYR